MLHFLTPHGDILDVTSFVLGGMVCHLRSKLKNRSDAKIARVYVQGIETGRDLERQSTGR